ATGAAGSGQTTVDTPQVSIGGVQATVSFSGLAPGFVALSQVNVQVPQQGVGGGFVSVVMSIGGEQRKIASYTVAWKQCPGQRDLLHRFLLKRSSHFTHRNDSLKLPLPARHGVYRRSARILDRCRFRHANGLFRKRQRKWNGQVCNRNYRELDS